MCIVCYENSSIKRSRNEHLLPCLISGILIFKAPSNGINSVEKTNSSTTDVLVVQYIGVPTNYNINKHVDSGNSVVGLCDNCVDQRKHAIISKSIQQANNTVESVGMVASTSSDSILKAKSFRSSERRPHIKCYNCDNKGDFAKACGNPERT